MRVCVCAATTTTTIIIIIISPHIKAIDIFSSSSSSFEYISFPLQCFWFFFSFTLHFSLHPPLFYLSFYAIFCFSLFFSSSTSLRIHLLIYTVQLFISVSSHSNHSDFVFVALYCSLPHITSHRHHFYKQRLSHFQNDAVAVVALNFRFCCVPESKWNEKKKQERNSHHHHLKSIFCDVIRLMLSLTIEGANERPSKQAGDDQIFVMCN